MGYRLPVFDVEVSAEKESAYTTLSQNELALQFYNSGMFNPQLADQALATMDMMEFQGKQGVIEKVQANGGMYRQMMQMQAQMLQMAQTIDALTGSTMADQMAAGINQGIAQTADVAGRQQGSGGVGLGQVKRENAIVANARERSAQSTAPR
jgi:cell fate (sporulation/competence/biofilm development) regulator YlbF (YheA/YmcA/DUF963 family)